MQATTIQQAPDQSFDLLSQLFPEQETTKYQSVATGINFLFFTAKTTKLTTQDEKSNPTLPTVTKSLFDKLASTNDQTLAQLKEKIGRLKPAPYNLNCSLNQNYREEKLEADAVLIETAKTYISTISSFDHLAEQTLLLNPEQQRKILVDIFYRETETNIFAIIHDFALEENSRLEASKQQKDGKTMVKVFSDEFIKCLAGLGENIAKAKPQPTNPDPKKLSTQIEARKSYRREIENQILSFDQDSQKKIITQLLKLYFTKLKKPSNTPQETKPEITLNPEISLSIIEHYLYYSLENLYRSHALNQYLQNGLKQQSLEQLAQNTIFANPELKKNRLLLESLGKGEIDLAYALTQGLDGFELSQEGSQAKKIKKKEKWYEKPWQWFITVFFGGGRTLATFGLSCLFFFTFVALFSLNWPTWLLIALGILSALATAAAFLLSRVVAIYNSYAPAKAKAPNLENESKPHHSPKTWSFLSIIVALVIAGAIYFGLSYGMPIFLLWLGLSVTPTNIFLVPLAASFAFAAGFYWLFNYAPNLNTWKIISVISALGAGATAYVGIALGITKLLALCTVSVSPTSIFIVPFAAIFAFSGGLSHLSFLAKDLDIKWVQFKNFYQGSLSRKCAIFFASLIIGLASGLILVYTAMSGTRKLLDLADNGGNTEKISYAAELLGAILTLANLITNTLSQVGKCVSFTSGENDKQLATPETAPEDFNVTYNQKSGQQRWQEIWIKYHSLSFGNKIIFFIVMLLDVVVYGGLGTLISSCLMCGLIGLSATAPATLGVSVVFAFIGLLVYGIYTWNAVYEKFGKLHQYEPITNKTAELENISTGSTKIDSLTVIIPKTVEYSPSTDISSKVNGNDNSKTKSSSDPIKSVTY